MILDTLDKLRAYAKALPALDGIADFLAAHPLETLALGRQDLAGGVYVTVSDAPLKAGGDYENHQKYLDLQADISGCEAMDYRPMCAVTPTGAYNPEKDVQFHSAPDEGLIRLAMVPGMFVIFAPQDAHRPCQGEPGTTVRKAVFKIPV